MMHANWITMEDGEWLGFVFIVGCRIAIIKIDDKYRQFELHNWRKDGDKCLSYPKGKGYIIKRFDDTESRDNWLALYTEKTQDLEQIYI